MAISDAMAGVINLLDPSNPSSVKTFPIQPIFGAITNPTGIAISDLGMVYYAVFEQGITGARQFFKLDTNTGIIKDYGIQGPNYPEDIYLRALITADNKRVFFNDLGFVFYIDTAADTFVPANIFTECCYLNLGNYDLALSSNQIQISGSSYIYDSDLNADSYYSMNDRELLSVLHVYGAKFSPDGGLLFQPSTNGIDVFDGQIGNLLNRISLPVPLSRNYDALVGDGMDNVLVAITGTNGNGIAILDLTSLTESLHLQRKNEILGHPQHSAPAGHSHHRIDKPNRHAPSAIQTVPHATTMLAGPSSR